MNIKKTAALFLTLMAALTFLSRALDSVTVTKAEVGYGRQGVVPYLIDGEGEFSPGRMTYISLPENMLVAEIVKNSGEMVKEGDVILILQLEELKKEQEKLTRELEQGKLALEQERLTALSSPRVTEETLALQQLAAAQRALETGRQDLAEAVENHAAATADLEQDYIQKKNRTREEVEEDNRRAMKSAKRAWESARTARDSAVRKAEREVEDRQKKLDRLTEAEAPEKEIEEAELALERAEEDLADAQEEHDIAVEEAEARMEAAEETYEDIDYGAVNQKEEQQKAYEDALKAEDNLLEDSQRKVKDLEESLYRAMEALENAKVADTGIAAGESAGREISRLRQESIKLDLAETEGQLEKIQELIDCKGQITADRDATVAEMELKAGDKIQAGEQIKLAVGALYLIGEVDKEKAQLLKEGSTMFVKPAGQQQRVEAEIQSINQMWEAGTAELRALMPEGEGWLGGSASFTVNMESGVYSCVIPIDALREDNKGFYCLAAEPKKTILGEEMTAVRIDVEVLEKSSTYAAVSGPVTAEMKLITVTNKSVAEGDRVRVMEG